MTSRKSTTKGKGKGKGTSLTRNVVPEVFQEMLAEALPTQLDVVERPLKRRRTGRRDPAPKEGAKRSTVSDHVEDDEDLEFEDVPGFTKADESDNASLFAENDSHPQQQQTTYRDFDDDSEDDDLDWEAIDFEFNTKSGEPSGDLELTLSTKAVPQHRAPAPRRKVVTKEERALRLQVHKMHVLCLLSYVDRRNDWCNDSEVQRSLRPLLNQKMLTFLKPRTDLSQFGRAESLKRGLDDVGKMWRSKFSVTTRGIRRSLWADNEEDLRNFSLPADADTCFDKSDFLAAAKELKGSRDLGAQQFCALLRSVGIEARLICSLQPLSFAAGGPAMPRSSPSKPKVETPEPSDEEEAIDIQGLNSPFAKNSGPGSGSMPFTAARRRLGHPNAADYHLPIISSPAPPPPKSKSTTIHESPYPVFWVEVLDEAHQKWLPVDSLVTQTIAKPAKLEPPAADRENSMSYVIAFEEDRSAKDVTRRYTKSYNAKTRKARVECTSGGEKWWRRTMRTYSRVWKSDIDQIEDTELVAAVAREPMPQNVADFKDHPIYALERHLRRNEVLIGNNVVGKVAVGRDPANPGQKKLEPVFRRKDVKTVKSGDAWYRLGREIKKGEAARKVVPAKRKAEDEEYGIDSEEQAGTYLYTEDQTELYEAHPVVNGLVPKNEYGNLDIYVPSMVPKGGVHLPYDEASRAARILGISYADALTGWEFRGRHGTAVLKGIVVATEYREAVEAVVQGFRDERAREEEERKTLNSLRFWKRFMIGLRIKERVDTYEVEGEEPDEPDETYEDDDGKGMESEEYDDDDFGGGFIPE